MGDRYGSSCTSRFNTPITAKFVFQSEITMTAIQTAVSLSAATKDTIIESGIEATDAIAVAMQPSKWAALPTATAAQITTAPTTAAVPSSTISASGSNGMTIQVKIGVGIGSAAALIFSIVICLLVIKLRAAEAARETKRDDDENSSVNGKQEMDGTGKYVEQLPDTTFYELAGNEMFEVEDGAARVEVHGHSAPQEIEGTLTLANIEKK
jgi:hypothetical protein